MKQAPETEIHLLRADALSRQSIVADRSQIDVACRAMFPPGAVVEVRIPKAVRTGSDSHPFTVSGYYDDHAKMAADICLAQKKYDATGIYWTVNPCDPALLARRRNRLQERADPTTADHNILRRLMLYVDVDARRASGISSSQEEHELAITCSRRIAEDRKNEWGPAILIDSGNGGHLLYRIDLPNDPQSLALTIRDRLQKSKRPRLLVRVQNLSRDIFRCPHMASP